MSKGAITALVIVIVIIVGGAIWWYASMSGAPSYQAPATTAYPAAAATTTVGVSVSSTMDMNGMNMSSTVTAPPTPAPTPSAGQSVAVTISNFAFSPATITVHKGTKVTWTNEDSAAHTVTGNNGGPASGDIGQGASYSYTFNTVGSFPYHCAIHPYMKATVTVVN